MKIIKNGNQTTLLADAEMWITDSDMEIVENRIFTPVITLPHEDLMSNYKEVTDEWKVEWEEEHKPEDPEEENKIE